jgi:hypothetical protein
MLLISACKAWGFTSNGTLLPRLRSYEMGKLISLEEVNASVLPAKVLVLLSKYAQAMRKHTGLVIKISSLNVFKHVHNTNKLTGHLQIQKLHRELLLEVNRHLLGGTMQTNQQRELGQAGGIVCGKDGEVMVSRNSGRVNSNNLEIESSLSINF